MQFFLILFTAFSIPLVYAHQYCGNNEPSEAQQLMIKNLALEEISAQSLDTWKDIHVNVHFHAIANSTAESDGYVKEGMLKQQLKVMNERYNPHDIKFKWASADWTINNTWANDGSWLDMKKALHKGTYADLNLYFIPYTTNLGRCPFPLAVTEGSDDFYMDGCVLNTGTLPGGTYQDFNYGMSTIHEVGHWFGLWHTFQGGCSGFGDYVDDTPAESGPAHSTLDLAGCSIGRDTCPGNGTDPVLNYMDYNYDVCTKEFTPGQRSRIQSLWEIYRA